MTRGLSQAQEKLESGEHTTACGEVLHDVGVRGDPQRVVDPPLMFVELTGEDDLCPGRKFARDLRLAAAQHERTDPGLQLDDLGGTPGLDRPAKSVTKSLPDCAGLRGLVRA